VIRLAALAAVVLLTASACGNSAAHGGSGVVTAGDIGLLRIDISTRADVVAFAGKPDVTSPGKTPWPGVPRYLALAYGCPGPSMPGLEACQSVYYVNTKTHRLVAFYTHSPHFHTASGIQPGMDQNAADRIAHDTPQGPLDALYESSPSDIFILTSSCRRVTADRCSGKVTAFMLESYHHGIGLTAT
jgi:hypothetical protein